MMGTKARPSSKEREFDPFLGCEDEVGTDVLK